MQEEAGPPEAVLEVWDGGVLWLGIEPTLLFAAWSDGVVVRRTQDRPMVGRISQARLQELLNAVEVAGFFDPPLEDGVLFPDGPLQAIRVRSRGRERVLEHYGREDAALWQYINGIGPHAQPSRRDTKLFVAMWRRVLAAIDAVTLVSVREHDGSRPLTYPR